MVEAATLRALTPGDAPALARLMSAYRAAMPDGSALPVTRGEARALIARAGEDAGLLLLGATSEGRLCAFALAFDLPEIIAGGRAGQLDDLFVAPEARGKGLARALIAELAGIGRTRGWSHLRWLVPRDNLRAKRLYAAIAEPAPWDSFRLALRDQPAASSG